MKNLNLDQIRAQNALDAVPKYEFTGKEKGEVVKKVPPMIKQNGLLGVLAFAIDDKKGYADVMKASIIHLESKDLYPEIRNALANSTPANILEKFTRYLCSKDAAYLRALTEEVLAFLNFLRRYVDNVEKWQGEQK